MFFDFIGSVYY